MKLLFALVTLLSASSTFAANLCSRYEKRPEYIQAIKAVAEYEKYTFEQVCNSPNILDIEAQPSHIVTPNGDVIPHVQIQLHSSYSSCNYMVNDVNHTITSRNCYSGW